MKGEPPSLAPSLTSCPAPSPQALSPMFVEYQKAIRKNAVALGNALKAQGFKLVSDGTDTHLFVVDLRPQNMDGSTTEHVLELVSISVNKNTVPGDLSPFNPSGLRLGACAPRLRPPPPPPPHTYCCITVVIMWFCFTPNPHSPTDVSLL